MKLLLPFLFAFFSGGRSSQEPFSCTLRPERTVYKLGEVPQLHVEITNHSGTAVYLPGSLDGSEEKRRMPYCYFTVEGVLADTIRPGKCGMMNPLREQDFVLVKPGQVFNPYEQVDSYGFFPARWLNQGSFPRPGTYRIQFHYSTDAVDKRRFEGVAGTGFGKDSARLLELLNALPKLSLKSNVVEIRVEGRP